jgi:MoaA/NifB/PqqE/SkfB family radical SAM enzyme
VANIGYIQVVRHCNHFCGFCSNPTTPYEHTLDSMKLLVDDLVARDYFGVILTGGEPTLHPELPAIAAYASGRGLDVRVITNGTRLADPAFARALADAGVRRVHVSIYSVLPDVEARLRGAAGTLERALRALDSAHEAGLDVHVNCVINRLNADHLDDNIRYFIERHPHVRHFVWNNLDPSMGRAEVNQADYVPRLADFELSLVRAMRLLHRGGRTFRVEKVPLCYMGEFGHASTETRKIVKGEERVVHFLDAKQTVRQTAWGHLYGDECERCRLRPICGGLFDRGGAYDPAELAPQFHDPEAIVRAILNDPADPSYSARSLADWRREFQRAGGERTVPVSGDLPDRSVPDAPAVGLVTVDAVRRYHARRRAEARRAEALGVRQERPNDDEV